jgi:hypothetical protein
VAAKVPQQKSGGHGAAGSWDSIQKKAPAAAPAAAAPASAEAAVDPAFGGLNAGKEPFPGPAGKREGRYDLVAVWWDADIKAAGAKSLKLMLAPGGVLVLVAPPDKRLVMGATPAAVAAAAKKTAAAVFGGAFSRVPKKPNQTLTHGGSKRNVFLFNKSNLLVVCASTKDPGYSTQAFAGVAAVPQLTAFARTAPDHQMLPNVASVMTSATAVTASYDKAARHYVIGNFFTGSAGANFLRNKLQHALLRCPGQDMTAAAAQNMYALLAGTKGSPGSFFHVVDAEYPPAASPNAALGRVKVQPPVKLQGPPAPFVYENKARATPLAAAPPAAGL